MRRPPVLQRWSRTRKSKEIGRLETVEGTCKCPACGYPNFLSEKRLLFADEDPVNCWHCQAFIDHHDVDLEPIVANRFQHLAGARVEMVADGIRYHGVFVEMTDEDVKLRGETGWIILDVNKVSRIYREGEAPDFPNPVKIVDRSFYDVGEDELAGQDQSNEEPETDGH